MGFIVRPSAWEVQHAGGIFQGQAYQAQNGGQLPDTPMWRMLEFRYSVNSARFTYFHPNIGRMIEQKLTPPPVTPPPVTPPPVDPGTITPPTPLEPPPVNPPPITPPPVDPPPITPPVDPPGDGGQIITPPPDGGGVVVPEPGAFSMMLVSVVVLGAFCLHLAKRATGREAAKQPAPSV